MHRVGGSGPGFKLLFVIALAAAAVIGCSSDGQSPAAPTASSSAAVPAPVDGCTATTGAWRALTGTPVPAAVLGDGPAVIFANDSGNGVCDWLPLAQRIVPKHRVAVFTYSGTTAAAEPQALRETLAVARAAGASGKFVLVGASLGGRIVIEAAAQHPAGLAGIVSLSGEATVEDYRDILPDARQVTTPALYVGARDDQLTDGVRQQNALHLAMRGRPNELVQRDGVAHGTDLIDPSTAGNDAIIAKITSFIAQVTVNP